MYQNGLQYALFFLLIFIFMFSIWDNERGEEAVLKELELLQKERALLDNMTLTTNRSAVVPPKVDSVVDTMMTNLTGPSYEDRYYRNVSGIYQGSWLPTSLPENTLSYNETLTESFDYRKSGSLEWTITAGLHQTENISLIEVSHQGGIKRERGKMKRREGGGVRGLMTCGTHFSYSSYNLTYLGYAPITQ